MAYRRRNNKTKEPNGYYAYCDGCIFGACHGNHYLGKDVASILQVLAAEDGSVVCPKCGNVTRRRLCLRCGLMMESSGSAVEEEDRYKSILDYDRASLGAFLMEAGVWEKRRS